MFIKNGDIVDIIAPSSPPKNNQWKKGVAILESWGLRPHLKEEEGLSPWLFHSNNNKMRSALLNRAFFNKSSSVVWMMRGGYGLQKIMPSFIKNYSKNFKQVKKKLFIGYSDGTALHLFLNGKKQPTLHAPLVSELPDLSQKNLLNLKNILFGIKKEIVFNRLRVFQLSNKIKGFSNPARLGKESKSRAFSSRGHEGLLSARQQKNQNISIKAPIIGGNLSLLSTSVGAPWWPSSFGRHFLFVEDINEADYRVDRLLHHLFYSGALKSVKAILFGCFSGLTRPSLRKVLKSFSDVCNIPLIFGLPVGHTEQRGMPIDKGFVQDKVGGGLISHPLCGHTAKNHPLPFNRPSELIIQGDKACLKIKL